MRKDDPTELADDDARILALESAAVTGHTLKLVVLEPGTGQLDVDVLRARVAARLDSQPRARHRVDTTGERPRWVECADFDIANHVRRHPVADRAPHADLLGAVNALMAEHLDRSRPLWTLDVIGPWPMGARPSPPGFITRWPTASPGYGSCTTCCSTRIASGRYQ